MSNPTYLSTSSSVAELVASLGREERLVASQHPVWCFKKVTDIVEGVELRLSNMAGGYPFEFAGVNWASSEQLYLCGEFTDEVIQRELLSVISGYAAKRFIKAKHKKEVREDFPTFRLQWMLYVVWQKCLGSEAFRDKLLSIPDGVILVEETTLDTGGTATVWGCKNPQLIAYRKELTDRLKRWSGANLTKKALDLKINIETNKVRNIGEFVGQNNIGKILMICRRCLIEGIEPPIDRTLLNSANITILGNHLTF
ncbi:NADAR family protein [Bacteroides acidifaciens]|uniref:NADAR family protein n=1 Tax=Bacteroides acidifaciens TaxID=85831 RepID=UPI0025AE3A38|nr:NADAR family protein [Bacteroides acidifaciens]